MLFNSYLFLFAFLPVTLIGYFLLTGTKRFGPAAVAWLVLASLFFYGFWDARYLALMGVSILSNYGFGLLLANQKRATRVRRGILIAGIAFNLALLGYFKYASFTVHSVNVVFGLHFPLPDIVLPLAISFFTFQQLAYLVDAYRGLTSEYRFADYCLFVTFFPQLIAGPIVHHKEMLPQFEDPKTFHPHSDNFAIGLTILIIGLFKKVVIADSLSGYANVVFDGAAGGTTPTFAEAWLGTLAYTFQIYFDFSGYSDMAIGLARLFGIKLPINFNSPYKARNMSEFWRRWHMTLSRFLRDYLYIPLGGSRKGSARRYVNLMVTMLLGGLWHGAGWIFVLWGGLHGLYLCIHHAFLGLRNRLGWKEESDGLVMHVLARAITFLAILLSMLVFRAADFSSAWSVLHPLLGLDGLETQTRFAATEAGAIIAIAWLIVWFFPNTQEFMGLYQPALFPERDPAPAPLAIRALQQFRWRPTMFGGLVCAVVLVTSVLMMSRVHEFLYFRF